MSELRALPARLDLVRPPDDDLTVTVSVVDSGDAAVDISGWTLEGEACTPTITDGAGGVFTVVPTGTTVGARAWRVSRTAPDVRSLIAGSDRVSEAADVTPGNLSVDLQIADGDTVTLTIQGGAGGASDHGDLAGLAGDDHALYALADGTRGAFEVQGAVSTHEAAPDPHSGAYASSTHAASHATGQSDALAPADIDAAPDTGQYAVNTVATSGATETLPATFPAHDVTMDQDCTFTFAAPTAGHTFLLKLSGAFTPTFPASVEWDAGTAPTYASPSVYGFTTLDGGTSWIGSLVGSALA